MSSVHNVRRIVSVVACTFVALACGTNYAYSAWAPQFAERMKLSATQTNLIGAAANLGMYGSGFPLGLLTDTHGPRLTSLIGAFSLGIGYYPIYKAYVNGEGFLGTFLLSFFAFLSGLGGCSAFSAAIKVAASNFPSHRGTATAFPLAAFGLSAFFWSTLSAIAFKDDTAQFLLLLTIGTFTLTLLSVPFLRIFPSPESYHTLSHYPSDGDRTESRRLRPAGSSEFQTIHDASEEAGMQSSAFQQSSPAHARSGSQVSQHRPVVNPENDIDETSSLVSKADSRPSEDTLGGLSDVDVDSPHLDIRGLAMLWKPQFWQLFAMMALLSGLGLMTINNIGNSAKALWKYYDDSVTPKFIQQQQVMHVSILSIGNFSGRLLSGIGSDILVQKLHMSRFWCLLISAVVFTLTQLAGSSISNPHTLVLVSGFTGVAYGFLFGVFPSLTAQTFGIGGLSQNWGVMILAPVLSGNIFNLIYGHIYDAHSVITPEGSRDCPDGLQCYQTAYYTTMVSGMAGIVVCIWSIYKDNQAHGHFQKKVEHDRLA